MSTDTDYTLLFWAAGSFVVGGLCYVAYSKGYYFAKQLENVPQYETDQKLLSDAQKASGYTIPYATVTGYASADGCELTSFHNSNIKGLISHTEVKEHFRSKNKKHDTWNKNWDVVSSHYSSTSFSLSNKASKIRLSVSKPLHAQELNLSTVYNHYEAKSSNISDKFFDFLTGHQVDGIETVEKMLLPDTKLTAVGKIVLHDGQLRVEPPESDLTYFLTRDSLESLIKAEESRNQAKRLVSYVFFSITVLLCGVWLYNAYKKYKSELEYQRLEEENSNDDDRCSVCLLGNKNIVLIPCGHVCICRECVVHVNRCPVCRKMIERKIPIYRS